MTKNPVISFKYLPFPVPWQATSIGYLLMDRFNPAELWWGVFWAIVVIAWLLWVLSLFTYESKEPVFKKEGGTN